MDNLPLNLNTELWNLPLLAPPQFAKRPLFRSWKKDEQNKALTETQLHSIRKRSDLPGKTNAEAIKD